MAYALNKDNLVAIGVLDDFLMAYQEIEDIYKKYFIEIKEEAEASNRTVCYDKADRLAKNEVKQICDSLVNRYRKIFGDVLDSLHISDDDFKSFSFLQVRRYRPGDLEYRYDIIKLDDFFYEIQRIVTKMLYAKRLLEKPKYLYEPFMHEVDDHIESFAQENTLNPSDDVITLADHERTDASLYVYDHLTSIKCYKEHHPVSATIFYGDAYERNRLVRLPVHYCESCNKYFIGSVTYSMYEKIWGAMVCEKYYYKDSMDEFEQLNNESKLHRYGYNVVEGKLTEFERQNLLVYLMDQNLMTYYDITQTIENNILRFQGRVRYNNAIDKWRKDLKYISDLVLDENFSNE